jgi:hypothetical protein
MPFYSCQAGEGSDFIHEPQAQTCFAFLSIHAQDARLWRDLRTADDSSVASDHKESDLGVAA